MYKFSTPTNEFTCITNTDGEPIDLSLLTELYITYSQNCRTVLEKTLADCTINGNVISVKLTQEDTGAFTNDLTNEVRIQLRLKFQDGSTYPSQIIKTKVHNVLKWGVI